MRPQVSAERMAITELGVIGVWVCYLSFKLHNYLMSHDQKLSIY